MLKIEQTRQFKRDYKREKRGRHRSTLEAAFIEVLEVLADNKSLAEKTQGSYVNRRLERSSRLTNQA